MKKKYWAIAGPLMLSSCENPQSSSNVAQNMTADYGNFAEPNETDLNAADNLTTISDNLTTNANGGPYTQSEPDSDKTARNKSKRP